MFTTIYQFSSLAQHTHIDGLDQMIKNFSNIVDDVKRKPYDLLDFHKNQYDRDILEFDVNIHDLEAALQVGCAPRASRTPQFHLLFALCKRPAKQQRAAPYPARMAA